MSRISLYYVPATPHQERYRSGHNGADSKSDGRASRHVGSNPTLSAITLGTQKVAIMNEQTSEKISGDYLETLEKVKEQYQQYIEVSRLYELPTSKTEQQVEYQPPTFDNPLTTNKFSMK